MDGWMHRWTDGWMDGRIDGWMVDQRERETYICQAFKKLCSYEPWMIDTALEENCIEVKRCGWWWYFLTHLLCPSFNWALKQLWGNALKDPAGHLVAGVVGMWVWQICRKCCEGAARNWERPCPGDQVLTGCCNFFDLASQEIPWCKMMQACPLVLLCSIACSQRARWS